MRTWIKAPTKHSRIGVADLHRLAESLLGGENGRTPFFAYRRLIILIDTPREKPNA